MIIEDDGPEDETCILKLCKSLLHFLRGGMQKASSLDAALQTDVKNLEAEAGKLQNHVVMRQSMWRETKAMEPLLPAVWDSSEGASPPCLPTWRNQATASSRSCWRSLLAAQPQGDYQESLFLPSASDLRSEDGCELVPYSLPQEFADFVEEWHVGAAVDHFARKLFYDHCDRIANCSLAQFSVAFGNFIIPLAKNGVAEGGCAVVSPWEVLRTFLPTIRD